MKCSKEFPEWEQFQRLMSSNCLWIDSSALVSMKTSQRSNWYNGDNVQLKTGTSTGRTRSFYRKPLTDTSSLLQSLSNIDAEAGIAALEIQFWRVASRRWILHVLVGVVLLHAFISWWILPSVPWTTVGSRNMFSMREQKWSSHPCHRPCHRMSHRLWSALITSHKTPQLAVNNRVRTPKSNGRKEARAQSHNQIKSIHVDKSWSNKEDWKSNFPIFWPRKRRQKSNTGNPEHSTTLPSVCELFIRRHIMHHQQKYRSNYCS